MDVFPIGHLTNSIAKQRSNTISVPNRLPPPPILRHTRGRTTSRKQDMSIFPKNFVDDYDEAAPGGLDLGFLNSQQSIHPPRRSSSRSSQKSSSSYDDAAVGAICCEYDQGFLPSSIQSNPLDEFLQESDDMFDHEASDFFDAHAMNMSAVLEDQQRQQQEQCQTRQATEQQHQQQQETRAFNGQSEQSLEHDHIPGHLVSLFGISSAEMDVHRSDQPASNSLGFDMSSIPAELMSLLQECSKPQSTSNLQPGMQQLTNFGKIASAQTSTSDQILQSIMSTASSFFPEDQSPFCAPSSVVAAKADEIWAGSSDDASAQWDGPSMFASLSDVPALHAQQTAGNVANFGVAQPVSSHLDSSVMFPKALVESVTASVGVVSASTINPSILSNTPTQTPAQILQSSFGTPRSASSAVFKEPLPPTSVSCVPSFEAANVLPSPALTSLTDFSPLEPIDDTFGQSSASFGRFMPPTGIHGTAPYSKQKQRKTRVKPGDPPESRNYTAPSQTSRKVISTAIAKKYGYEVDALGNPIRPDNMTDEQWAELSKQNALDQAEEKRKRNREAQRSSREKRQREFDALQEELEQWRQHAQTLAAENSLLKQQLQAMGGACSMPSQQNRGAF
ncbi:hypothetical protein QFC22_001912 [Naganishia vaughanmartiniae]|uniref:Uncharacterized protein n=1 Tax=Naganishia vaughanmartiniae TaxID=1424756 RepID=A0ACC2XEL8_9TREE|nr:hypothetical protein QFC22_001912 [Naganishia vaughanmartiniae]